MFGGLWGMLNFPSHARKALCVGFSAVGRNLSTSSSTKSGDKSAVNCAESRLTIRRRSPSPLEPPKPSPTQPADSPSPETTPPYPSDARSYSGSRRAARCETAARSNAPTRQATRRADNAPRFRRRCLAPSARQYSRRPAPAQSCSSAASVSATFWNADSTVCLYCETVASYVSYRRAALREQGAAMKHRLRQRRADAPDRARARERHRPAKAALAHRRAQRQARKHLRRRDADVGRRGFQGGIGGLNVGARAQQFRRHHDGHLLRHMQIARVRDRPAPRPACGRAAPPTRGASSSHCCFRPGKLRGQTGRALLRVQLIGMRDRAQFIAPLRVAGLIVGDRHEPFGRLDLRMQRGAGDRRASRYWRPARGARRRTETPER